jgi:hypothetical protein
MEKLTLVSLMCRGKVATAFLTLPYFNGKPVIHQSTIDKVFQTFFNFTPERGETISFL